MTPSTCITMASLLRLLCDELANEWGYVIYLILTVWFSIRVLRDRQRDIRYLSSLIAQMEARLGTRLGNIENSIQVGQAIAHRPHAGPLPFVALGSGRRAQEGSPMNASSNAVTSLQ